MKTKRFTERQIFAILKEGESGVMIVPDLCRKHGVRQSTYYKWNAK
jgi:putative transposase